MLNVLVAIIIYRTNCNDSATIQSLILPTTNNCISIKVVIYDNSPHPQQFRKNIPGDWEYIHNPLNGGLAEAYNYALSKVRDPSSWLLLLDQDSVLPTYFIDNLLSIISEVNDDSISAIAPHVLCNNQLISPCGVLMTGRLKGIPEKFLGKSIHELMAINSGMAVRASFLREIGGFNHEFWLDYLDHWLCRTIYARGKKIYVSTSILNHELSVSNYNEVSENRALNILKAEVLFYRKYKSKLELIVYFFRLIIRGFVQVIKLKNKKIAFSTLKAAISLFFNRNE